MTLQPPQDPGSPIRPPAPPLSHEPRPCTEAAERQMPVHPPRAPLWQPPQQPQQQPQQPQQQLRQQTQQQQPQWQGWQQPSHPPPTSPPPSPPHQWPQQPQLPQWAAGHSLGAGPPGPGLQQGLADGTVGGAGVGETRAQMAMVSVMRGDAVRPGAGLTVLACPVDRLSAVWPAAAAAGSGSRGRTAGESHRAVSGELGLVGGADAGSWSGVAGPTQPGGGGAAGAVVHLPPHERAWRTGLERRSGSRAGRAGGRG